MELDWILLFRNIDPQFHSQFYDGLGFTVKVDGFTLPGTMLYIQKQRQYVKNITLSSLA